ncbi:hypothetical protein BASA81_002781 [Batrachochytrium salamandrivorans]|nr:hypothetical protein BASA81_002781 [Batrachochytrium salamandrivorans]
MSAVSMSVLTQHCGQSLRKLLLRGCKRIGFPNWSWIANLPALEHLDLCCTGCSDLTIRLLCSPKLKWIELGFMAGNHVHPSVTDTALQLLASKCPLIEGIDLRGCKRLTDGGIRRYCQQQSTRIQSLVLHSCDVGDDTLAAIATNCPHLQALDIHRCIRVSNTGIQSLQLLEGIRRLDLSNLNISDVGLMSLAVALCCMRLEELDLRTCKLVTGFGVLALVQTSRHTLQYLDLNGCNQVTPACIGNGYSWLRPQGKFKCLEIGGRDDDVALRHVWTRQDVQLCKQTFHKFGATVHATFDALVVTAIMTETEDDV